MLEDAVMITEETTGQDISLYINHKMDLFNQRSKQISVLLPGCIEDVGCEVGRGGVPLPLLQTSDEELRTFVLVAPSVTAVAATPDQNWDKLGRKERQF